MYLWTCVFSRDLMLWAVHEQPSGTDDRYEVLVEGFRNRYLLFCICERRPEFRRFCREDVARSMAGAGLQLA